MSGPSSSRDADNSGTWPSSSAAFNVNAGRNAFRTMDPDDSENPDMLRRQQFVMRSFTQSIEMDLPPAPELPPDLDIDRYNFDDTEQPAREPGSRLTSSSTADTIVEVKSRHHHDAKLGETQKYVMTVPEPGHTEQEMEMHASLMRAESGDESDPELAAAAASTAAAARKSSGPPVAGSRHESTHHDPLRREFSNSVMQRPRPTTPTSLSTLEAYAAEQEVAPTPTDAKEKIKVVIPKKAIKSRQPEDFYHSMASQMPPQCRGRAPDSQPDVDIIENNPDYRDKAPPTPVVHRRSSVEWEAFEESKTDWSAASMADDEEAGAQKPNGTAEQVKPETAAAFAEELFGNDEWATEPPAVRENEPDEQEPIPPADVTESKKTPADEGESAVDATEVDAKAAELAHEAVEATTTKAPSEAKQEHPIPTWDLPDQDQEPTDEPTWGDPPVPVTSVEGDQPASTDDANPTVTDFEANAEAAETYDPSQYYDYSAYGYDANYYANYGQEGAPVEGTAAAEGYDQSAYAGYDPAAYAGYDATTGSYDTSGAYDYSQYGAYDPSAAGYDSSAAAYANYDASVAGYSYDPSDPAYAMPTAVDPNAADYSAYQAEGYAEGYDYSAAAVAESTEYPPTVAAATHDYPIQDPDAQPHDYSKLAEIVATEEHKLAETADADGVAPAAAEQPAYDPAAYYDTAQYEDYSKYGYPAAIDTETTQHHFVEPLPPLTGTEPDPYSWEAQTSDYSAPAAAEPVPAPEPAETKVVEEAEAPVAKVPPPRPAPAKPPPPRPAAPQPARPPPPSASASAAPPPPPPPKKQESEEEDAWAKFNKLSAQVTSAVKSTEEKIKELGETTAANEIHDESYVSSVGGSQGMMTPAVLRQMQQVEEEKKKAKADKKKAKKLKRPQSPELDPNREMDMDRAAAELVAKLAKTRAHDIGDWRPPGSEDPVVVPKEPASPSSSEEDLPVPAAPSEPEPEPEPTEPEPTEESSPEPPPIPSNWAGFDETEQQRVQAELPPSDSDFFSIHLKGAPPVTDDDPFAPPKPLDPFAVSNGGDAFDPFDIRSAEDIVAQAKERANLIAAQEDLNADVLPRLSSGISTPTPEGGSPVSPRPAGFEDEFQMEGSDFASPLYDEDDSAPLEVFPKPFTGDGWELMIRYPPKKKIMGDRYWKACYVKIQGNMLYILNSKTDPRPMQEIMLQPTYSLSDNTLQAYDVYGKIHTIKLQHVQYKERVGIRAGQISRLVEGHVTKYGLPIEHAAQITVLAKFGSLNADEFNSFVNVIEDFLFNAPIKREVAPVYKQDEVQIHCYDEYQAHVDKNGFVSNQLARVRMFCLAFVTGSPFLEIGLNDRRRQGKEIVRRKDILPMYTERWIRFENLDFHSTIDKKAFEEEQLLKLSPPDGVFFEMCRFRIRPPKNKEKPLQIKSVMKIAGSKIEIRINAMAAAQTQRARGTVESIRTIPCEDIVIKFPIPEAWIYIFREERHWGVGSVHSKMRKPGKVKNLKDRIMGAVQTSEATLIEVAAGEAKYEHVYRSLVWRIPRLPVRDAAAYKDYMLKCRFDLSSFDLMPEVFMPNCDVDFTMPLATVSHTVVRSVSVEQHEDSDRVEKYVRYVAKCKYDVEIDYVQCNDLDNDVIFDPTVANPEAAMAVQPEQHKALFDPDQVAQQHGDYGIEFSETEFGGASRKRNDSSSDEEPEKRPIPIIEIDMKGYGY